MKGQSFRFTKTSSRDYYQDPTGQAFRKDPSLDLKVYLESQPQSKSLRLADMGFGDEGAEILSQYLQKNSTLESLELRGNSLTSDGFAKIIESLMGNTMLKQLSAEWNNIGSGVRGVESLTEFVAQNNSIEHIDLRNNKLSSSSAQSIANLIRASNSVKTLDLRWNDLGNHGAKAIINSIEANSKILYVELKGNNVTDDILDDLNSKLDNNRQQNQAGMGAFRTSDIGARSNILTQNQDKFGGGAGASSTSGIKNINEKEVFADLQIALSANSELERALVIEQRKNNELKEKYYRELDLNTRDHQTKIDQLMREGGNFQTTVKNLENENAVMKKQNSQLQDKVNNLENMHLQDLQTIEEYDKTIRKLEQDLRQNEAQHRTSMDRIANDTHLKTVEIENSYDLKYKEMLRENEYLNQRNRDLEAETKRLAEENRGLMFGVEDKIRESSFKAREEERAKNLSTIRQLETSLRAAEEEIFKYQRDTEEKEIVNQRKLNYLEDKVHQADEEIKRLKYEVNLNVDYYNKEKLKTDSLQNEITSKDSQIQKLQSDLRENQKTLQTKEIGFQDQVELLQRENSEEVKRGQETKDTLTKRVSDLERQNHQLRSDLNRLRNDLQNVKENLISNLSQTVHTTFSDLHK